MARTVSSYVFRMAPLAAAVLVATMLGGGARAHLMAAAGAPPAPVGLSSSVAGSTVTLAWGPGPGTTGAVSYQLEVGSAPGLSNLFVSEYLSPGLVAPGVPDGLYFVRVRARNAAGFSGPSNELAVRVGCVGPPAAPTGLVTQVAGSAVSIGWQPVSGATSYVLEAGWSPGTADVGAVPLSAPGFAANAATGTYYVRVRATNACGSSAASAEVVVNVGIGGPPPQTSNAPIFGAVDPVILGTCSAAMHDAWSVDGGDGFRYRTWHPQSDPRGCVYAHEHGDNPTLMQNAEIAASPVRFGYIGRRHPTAAEPNGHDEAHEGFKVFIANPGDVNNEFRVNRVFSRSVFHMGTGGPKRFNMPHHSAEIRVVHPEFGLKAFTQLMMNTGGVGAVCDPRVAGPVKDVVQLNSPCPLTSVYEIWSTTASVMHGGREVYRSFATPAVFDPITVLNPANPTELVYAWDPRVAAIRVFHDDWSVNRGCRRESYAQPGYWFNSRGSTTYVTDAMGQEVAPSDPHALVQLISTSDSVGAPATIDGNHQFKMIRDYCQQASRLGLKN